MRPVLRTSAMRSVAAKIDFTEVVGGAYSYIDTYTGTNTATLGTHQSGDILVAIASRDTSTTAPSIPAGNNWTTLSSTGSNSLSYALVGKIATGSSETVGTFTNATSVSIVHLRPGTGISPAFGAVSTGAGANTVNQSIPALTLSVVDGSSLVLGIYIHSSADISGMSTAPSGMTHLKTNQDATDTQAIYVSSNQVASWTTKTVSFAGTAGPVRCLSLEILLPSPNDSTPNQFTFTDQTNVAISTLTESNVLTLSGTNVEASISVTGGEYSINGGAFTSASGTISPSSTFKVRCTSSSLESTAVDALLTIGGVSDTFRVTTGSSSDEFLAGWDNTPVSSDMFFDAAAANDSGTGTEASPYKTITVTRLHGLTAGKRAWFKNGNYNFVQAISGLSDGTAGSRITLAAYPGHTPTFIGSPNATDMDVQCAIGNVAYWDFRNLTVSAVTWGILVGPRQWNLAECPVNHVRFIGCTFTKTQTGSTYGDNSGCLFVDSQSDYIDVAYCSFTGAGSTAFNNNALLWIDRIPHFKCVGNVFDNCNSLLYYKHNHQLASNQVEVVVKNNIFSRATTRTNLLCVNYMTYTGNAHYQCSADVSDDGGDGSAYSRTGIVSNNTFLDSDVLIYKSGTVTPDGWMLRNNLFLGTSQLHDNPDNQSGGQDFNTNTDFNAYTAGNAIKRNGATRTVAAHKIAFTDQEQNSPAGSNNTISATGSRLLPAYWQLTGGNAIGGGQGGVNCGADYTKLLTGN